MNKNAKEFVVACEERFGINAVVTRDGITQVCNESGAPYPYWLVTKSEFRYDRGQYKVPPSGEKIVNLKEKIVNLNEADCKVPEMAYAQPAQVLEFRQPKLVDDSEPAVPEKWADYVPFGFFKDMRNIVSSKQFYPVFVTGLSGNGKTLMVEQVCAELNRECIRVNISVETDESDLLGGPTLVNGNVVNRDGPVLIAMKRGAVLLIDEVDRGSNKLMCLQGIMEGKPHYNKKSGEMVYPAKGFNIIATANTKGRGSDEGKYLSQILDDAFLERFPITVEQEYPDAKTEKKILLPLIPDANFVDNLVQWADVVRKSYDEGATDEIISTRRLVHIAKAFEIFKDRMKAITLCVNRFDEETKMAFLDLYSKVDASVESPANTSTMSTTSEVAN
jgi:AAA domain (dynein-related subfamily)/CbbQ/NirQ/NorQ C-terminal